MCCTLGKVKPRKVKDGLQTIDEPIEYWRVVDLQPKKRIRDKKIVNILPQLGVNNPWDHMRVNNFVQPAPLPRRVKLISELEADRERIYGKKVYLTGAEIFGKIKDIMLNIPARNPDRKVPILDSHGNHKRDAFGQLMFRTIKGKRILDPITGRSKMMESNLGQILSSVSRTIDAISRLRIMRNTAGRLQPRYDDAMRSLRFSLQRETARSDFSDEDALSVLRSTRDWDDRTSEFAPSGMTSGEEEGLRGRRMFDNPLALGAFYRASNYNARRLSDISGSELSGITSLLSGIEEPSSEEIISMSSEHRPSEEVPEEEEEKKEEEEVGIRIVEKVGGDSTVLDASIPKIRVPEPGAPLEEMVGFFGMVSPGDSVLEGLLKAGFGNPIPVQFGERQTYIVNNEWYSTNQVGTRRKRNDFRSWILHYCMNFKNTNASSFIEFGRGEALHKSGNIADDIRTGTKMIQMIGYNNFLLMPGRKT